MIPCEGPCHGDAAPTLPEHRFLEKDLVQLELSEDRQLARCVRCKVAADVRAREVTFTCEHCSQEKNNTGSELRNGQDMVATWNDLELPESLP